MIPIFPLPDVVMFPRVGMPLHIFEHRYRKMIADALLGPRIIGISLLRPGWEPDYEGRPPVYEIGCAGRIEEHEQLEDGRSNIVLRAMVRFRITEEHAGEPYRIASVEELDDPPGRPHELEEARRRVVSAIAKASEGPGIDMQADVPAEILVNAVCQTLPLQPIEKQSLLEADGVMARYARLLDLLQFREHEDGSGGTRVH